MSKSILVLEENSVIHGLVAAALDMDGLTLHHEFNPARYLERARTLRPDLILVSNADQGNNYAILRQLKTQPGTGTIPVVLLANSRDRVDSEQIKTLKVAGVVRKPFEASDLQLQVSKHLDLVDLIGSSFEYRASQSVRDEGINPLTQIDVLDPEVTALMQDSGRAGPPLPDAVVPDVDFSAELRTESTAQTTTHQTVTTTTRTATYASQTVRSAQGGLEVLDDGPVESFSAGAPEPLTGEDVLLDEAELLPPLGTEAAGGGAEPFQEGLIEELGPEDLLDDETYEETTFGAQGVDRTLLRMPGSGAGSLQHLDEIEVELAADDVLFPEPPAPPAAAPRAPQATARAAPAAPVMAPPRAPAAQESGELPPAVRRMMELRPVFSKTPDAATLEMDPLAVPAGTSTEPAQLGLGDDELDEAAILKAMEQEDLAQLEDLDASDPELLSLNSSEDVILDEIEATADLAPLSAIPEQDDQDITIDEDEEELILSSLEEDEEPLARPTGLDLTHEERQGLTEALDVEERKAWSTGTTLTSTTTVETESASALLSSSTFAATDAFAATERPASTVEDDIAKADLEEMDLLDDMGLNEPGPQLQDSTFGSSSEEERFLSATFQNTQPSERPPGKFGLELPTSELLEVPVPDPLGGDLDDSLSMESSATTTVTETISSASWEAQSASMGRPQDPWPAAEALPDAPPESSDVDMSMFETTTTTTTTMEEESESSSAADGVSESFEDAFAALKEEIELNPKGERLDDILKMEQLQDQVAKIEFTIPQHEHALARGIPVYEVPQSISGRVSVDAAKTQHAAAITGNADMPVESMRRMVEESSSSRTAATTVKTTVTTQTTTAVRSDSAVGAGVPLDLSGSLLDEATKARLSQVLDEIISVSVRKAVREEMPRLMQRIAKETGPSASA